MNFVMALMLLSASLSAGAACHLRVNEVTVPESIRPQMERILYEKGYRIKRESRRTVDVAPLRLVFSGRQSPNRERQFLQCEMQTGPLSFTLETLGTDPAGERTQWVEVFRAEGEVNKGFAVCEHSATQWWHGNAIILQLKKLPHCSDLEYEDFR